MRKLAVILALIAMMSGGEALRAQGIIAPGHVLGNGTASPRTPTDTPLPNILDQYFSTNGFIYRSGPLTYATIAPGIGLAISGGALNLQPAQTGAIGGVFSSSAPSGECANGIDTSGNLLYTNCGSGSGTNAPPQDFVAANGDFTPGVTTTLTLTNPPSSKNGLAIFFDGMNQSFNTWSLSGSVVTFSVPITAQYVVEARSIVGGGTATSIDAAGATGITNGTPGGLLFDNAGNVDKSAVIPAGDVVLGGGTGAPTDSGVPGSTLNALTNACTTSGQLGMDPTGTTANDTEFATWLAQVALSPTDSGCLSFGPGKFRFASAQTINLPNPLWSTSSTTSNTIGTGTKTFTVSSCSGITTGPAQAQYQSQTTPYVMSGTVTSCTGTTLTMSISSVVNSGTFTAWSIYEVPSDGVASSATGAVTIKGQGPDTTVLSFDSGSGGGLFFQYSGLVQRLNLSDMSITTAGTATPFCVELYNSFPFEGFVNAVNQISHVTCRGGDGYGVADYWEVNFLIAYVSNINFDGVQAYGPAGTTGTGYGIELTNTGSSCGAPDYPWECGEVYNVRNSYFAQLQYCALYGANTQFLNFDGNQCQNSDVGIAVPSNAGVLQGLTVTNNTFFTYQECISDNNGVLNEIIANNLCTMNAGYYAIYLASNWAFTIANNHFVTLTGAPLGAIDIAGTSNDIGTITGNVISGKTSTGSVAITTCINLASGSSGVNVQSNNYADCTTKVNNSGSGNTVGGGSD